MFPLIQDIKYSKHDDIIETKNGLIIWMEDMNTKKIPLEEHSIREYAKQLYSLYNTENSTSAAKDGFTNF